MPSLEMADFFFFKLKFREYYVQVCMYTRYGTYLPSTEKPSYRLKIVEAATRPTFH